MKVRIYIVLSALVGLTACGTPGVPRPPSLRLPETVRDLAASRQGSTVTLTWTEPQRTTDGETIRALGPTLVCMGVNDFPMTHCAQVAADLSLSQYAQCAPQVGQPASCQVTLALELQGKYPLGQATYAIEVLNANGRSAGLSNQVRVPMVPTLPPPGDVRAQVRADGVAVSWTGELHEHQTPELRHEYRVLRRAMATEAETEIGMVRLTSDPHAEVLDRAFEWGKTYAYRVEVITTAQLPEAQAIEVRGSPSVEAVVTTRDVYPPAAPEGVQAVASGVGQQPFVDLTWAPNTDSDLAGYNVYRRAETVGPTVGKIVEVAMTKLNFEPVKTPSYRDSHVQSGMKYFYVVTAVDLRGNESSKSQEASETVH